MRRKRKIVGLRNGRVKEHFFFFFKLWGMFNSMWTGRKSCNVKEATGLILRLQKMVNRLGKSEVIVTDF